MVHVIVIVAVLLLGSIPLPAQGVWKPAHEISIDKIDEVYEVLRDREPQTLRQPTILAYKTATFLATGSIDTPTIGRTQSISAQFEGGEQVFDRVIVTVKFMGYADDSLIGERFLISLAARQEGVWQVTGIDRSAYGRGDHN